MSNAPDPQLVECVRASVRRMPRLTRKIFLAHRVEELSYTEIARRYGLTVEEVERHIARAIILLDRDLSRPPRRWWKFW